MKMNLFDLVYKYREKENCSPLENFSSSILYYLLNNSKSFKENFLNLLSLSENKNNKIDFSFQEEAELINNTDDGQKYIIPDIKIKNGDSIYYVEVKVYANLNYYRMNGKNINQIEFYKQYSKEKPKEVFLLSRNPDEANAITWKQICEELDVNNEIQKEYKLFLKENVIEDEKPLSFDDKKCIEEVFQKRKASQEFDIASEILLNLLKESAYKSKTLGKYIQFYPERNTTGIGFYLKDTLENKIPSFWLGVYPDYKENKPSIVLLNFTDKYKDKCDKEKKLYIFKQKLELEKLFTDIEENYQEQIKELKEFIVSLFS